MPGGSGTDVWNMISSLQYVIKIMLLQYYMTILFMLLHPKPHFSYTSSEALEMEMSLSQSVNQSLNFFNELSPHILIGEPQHLVHLDYVGDPSTFPLEQPLD